MLKSKSTKGKTSHKRLLKDSQKKDTKLKSGVFVRGSDKNDYIISVQDGKSYFDIAMTASELKELYYLLERKYGEFIGYKIK